MMDGQFFRSLTSLIALQDRKQVKCQDRQSTAGSMTIALQLIKSLQGSGMRGGVKRWVPKERKAGWSNRQKGKCYWSIPEARIS